MRPAAPSSRFFESAHYEPLVKIATGGTATVFLARERGSTRLDKLVAIKRMHPYLADDRLAREQLVREAQIASRLDSRYLVPIHEVEQAGEELLLVMDYIEGGSLAQLLSAGPLTLPVALRIIDDACRGLKAVHECKNTDGAPLGLVHRDVSPQNILVGTDGIARLSDFGLAKRTEISTSHTGMLRGKLAYMAPEQIDGFPGDPAQRFVFVGGCGLGSVHRPASVLGAERRRHDAADS